MKAVVQRVTGARCVVGEREVGRCGPGLVVLLGVLRGDDEAAARRLARRVGLFRVFADSEGRMNLDGLAAGAEALVISQFTLAADGRKGRRPSFDRAAPPEVARPLYELFVDELRRFGLPVETGEFGAPMRVHLVNDGPVTFVLEEEGSGRGAPEERGPDAGHSSQALA